MALAIVVCGVMSAASLRSPAAAPASPPAVKPDPNLVQWRFHCDLEDGRRFIADGSFFVEARYLPGVPVPEQSLPPRSLQRLLQSPSDREFGLSDLEQKGVDGHYVTRGGLQLNRKYIDLLRSSPLKPAFRFRARGIIDPVVIVDGEKVVGVIMPMRPASTQPAPPAD
jgi:hypothetical protein